MDGLRKGRNWLVISASAFPVEIPAWSIDPERSLDQVSPGGWVWTVVAAPVRAVMPL